MKRYPRPARCKQTADYELTEQGYITTLPNTPIEYTVTPAGKGHYLPTKGKFLQGEDDRRHTFNFEECSLGGNVSALSLMIAYPAAYGESDEEWEEIAWERMEKILRLRTILTSNSIAV